LLQLEKPRNSNCAYSRPLESLDITKARIFGTFVPKPLPRGQQPPRTSTRWLKRYTLPSTFVDYYLPSWADLNRVNTLQLPTLEKQNREEQLANARARGKAAPRKGQGKRNTKLKKR